MVKYHINAVPFMYIVSISVQNDLSKLQSEPAVEKLCVAEICMRDEIQFYQERCLLDFLAAHAICFF